MHTKSLVDFRYLIRFIVALFLLIITNANVVISSMDFDFAQL